MANARARSRSTTSKPCSRPSSASRLNVGICRYATSVSIWIRKRICNGSDCGRAAGRTELAAEGALRTLCRAVQRLVVHLAARDQPPDLDLPHPPVGHAQAVQANSEWPRRTAAKFAFQ